MKTFVILATALALLTGDASANCVVCHGGMELILAQFSTGADEADQIAIIQERVCAEDEACMTFFTDKWALLKQDIMMVPAMGSDEAGQLLCFYMDPFNCDDPRPLSRDGPIAPNWNCDVCKARVAQVADFSDNDVLMGNLVDDVVDMQVMGGGGVTCLEATDADCSLMINDYLRPAMTALMASFSA